MSSSFTTGESLVFKTLVHSILMIGLVSFAGAVYAHLIMNNDDLVQLIFLTGAGVVFYLAQLLILNWPYTNKAAQYIRMAGNILSVIGLIALSFLLLWMWFQVSFSFLENTTGDLLLVIGYTAVFNPVLAAICVLGHQKNTSR